MSNGHGGPARVEKNAAGKWACSEHGGASLGWTQEVEDLRLVDQDGSGGLTITYVGEYSCGDVDEFLYCRLCGASSDALGPADLEGAVYL